MGGRRKRDRQTDRQADRQTDRQREGERGAGNCDRAILTFYQENKEKGRLSNGKIQMFLMAKTHIHCNCDSVVL